VGPRIEGLQSHHVGPLFHDDPGVGPKLPVELGCPHVDGVNQGATAIYLAAAMAMAPRLLPRERYGQFVSANLMLGMVGMIFAPPLIGWLLQTKALIMIIFVNILLDKQLITSDSFTALLLMAVASTMLTIPVASPKLERMREIIFRSK